MRGQFAGLVRVRVRSLRACGTLLVRVRSLRACGTLVLASAYAACGPSVPANRAIAEPIAVSGSQFFSGDLPGTPPPPDGGAASAAGPSILEVDYNNRHVIPGASGKSFSGLVSTDAVAVGVRLADLGSGYWVVPVGPRDSQAPNASDFGFGASFDVNDPPGNHPLRVVGINYAGNAGLQVDTTICIASRIPDNNHACDRTQAVPAAVFTLQWDANFDLDLHVVAPDGTDINPKTNPLQFPVDAGQPPAEDPKIDRDSLGRCIPDGLRQEDLVFPAYPAVGPYDVYADPFDACGQAAVRFTLTIYEAGGDGELHVTYSQGGELLASSVTGGGSTGLFVAEKQFN
jgi:hypothetical protein